jgi:hypothetical protein
MTQGFTPMDVKNYWSGGDAYNGINVTMRDASGQVFEVQFHTQESFDAARANHGPYDEYRSPDTTPERREELWSEMMANIEGMEVPVGVESVGRQTRSN